MFRIISVSAIVVVASASAACQFLVDTDYDIGSGGPNGPSADANACCAACAASPDCWASVFDPMTGGVCWQKTKAQTDKPGYNAGVTACWPAGRPPPPAPSPPPPPPPPLYNVTVISLPAEPIISYEAGSTPWPQSFNPSWVEASAGTRSVAGLLVRSQNCSFEPGVCVSCNCGPCGPGDRFLGSVISFAPQNVDGSFALPYLVFAPEPGNAAERLGTEDPRIALDKTTGLYHMYYTCYGDGGGLCHATTLNPTAPYPGSWTRQQLWPGKSAALLLRPTPPHYLYQGDSSIALWSTTDLLNYSKLNDDFITTRADKFDSALVEAGPPPLLLSDGNYVFFHNSANGDGYHPGYVILNGSDPTTYIQRSEVPLLSPTRDWEQGMAPAECNVKNVVFLEAAAPVPGQVDVFDVYFGGSDAVVGMARIAVTKL